MSLINRDRAIDLFPIKLQMHSLGKRRDLKRPEEHVDVIAQHRQRLLGKPDDMDAIRDLVKALRARGEYREAVQWLERLDLLMKQEEASYPVLRGGPGAGLAISLLQWMMGNRPEGISRMHAMCAGILKGSIRYGDLAGGMVQGLLLHYMGVTAKNSDETSYALNYLRNRVKRLRSRRGDRLTGSWPCSIALYLLGEIEFDGVMEEINRKGLFLNVPDAAERHEKRRRIQLAQAVFHDGVKSRASGDEEKCLARMRECCQLVDPPFSAEGDLARYEVKEAAAR